MLHLSSGKSPTSTEVLHVPEDRKNLVSSSVLSKNGFKQILESNKFVITNNGIFMTMGSFNYIN